MASVSDLIPGMEEIKMALAVVVAGLLLGGIAYLAWEWHDLQTLKKDNATLTENNKVLQVNAQTLQNNLTAATNANKTETETIQGLIKERADAQKAVNALAAQKAIDQRALAATSAQLSKLLQNPANDGSLSPDLRETIRSIEAARSKQ